MAPFTAQSPTLKIWNALLRDFRKKMIPIIAKEMFENKFSPKYFGIDEDGYLVFNTDQLTEIFKVDRLTQTLVAAITKELILLTVKDANRGLSVKEILNALNWYPGIRDDQHQTVRNHLVYLHNQRRLTYSGRRYAIGVVNDQSNLGDYPH